MLPIRERVRRRIVSLLDERHLSQAELARRLHIATSHISEMCKGTRGWPWERLDEIAMYLGVPTADLFMDDPAQWTGRRDRRHFQRRSGNDRRRS
jgi:transcriptional regulator with XRE-family HTH domain